MSDYAAVILAAGLGTRMKSSLPKVLHRVCGLPMILWSVTNARSLSADPIVLVVGYGAEDVHATVGDNVLYAQQEQQLGTGHATLQAREQLLGRAGAVLVLYGDMPTLRLDTLERMVALHSAKRPAMTILTALSNDSMGFGRVVRDGAGRVREVVEEAVATPEILALKELNCGVYCFDSEWLWRRLPDVPITQPKGEYYLTDTIALAVQDGAPVEVVTITDIAEVQGINTRVHLARTERILRERTNERLMLEGVTLVDPTATYVEASVRVGRDTTIHPNTYLQGDTVIGERCAIGPNAIIRDTRISDACTVLASTLEGAVIEEGVHVGPYGRLRPGAHLAEGVYMGSFGEVKNSYLGAHSHMGHFSYVGDADIGREVNVAAGTITCNFDGKKKHRTTVGDGAFLGSGTKLVAPVRVGRGAKTGAGSVVTHDIPDNTLAYGVPARAHGRVGDPEEDQEDEKT